MIVDARKIPKLFKHAGRAQVALHFEDGRRKTEGILSHKPQSRLRGDLAQQLALVLTPKNLIQVTPPFHQTSLRGVLAAGDCSSPMQTVNGALYSGTCTGAGAPGQLQYRLRHWASRPCSRS